MSMTRLKLVLWTIYMSGSLVPLKKKGNQHIYKVNAILAANLACRNNQKLAANCDI